VQPSQFAGVFPHADLTGRAVTWPFRLDSRGWPRVDVIFILALLALYGTTQWLIAAISRLGSIE